MVTSRFKDFKAAISDVVNMDIDINRQSVNYTNIRTYKVTKDSPIVQVKYMMGGEEMQMHLFKRVRRDTPMNVPILKNAYSGLLPINEDKKADLVWMCEEGIIPEAYHDFYTKIPSATGLQEESLYISEEEAEEL